MNKDQSIFKNDVCLFKAFTFLRSYKMAQVYCASLESDLEPEELHGLGNVTRVSKDGE